ncbi:MAG TPA: DedA family protein, partial [Anaerolineales bacterium]|nr:DedA family protein [Anaerolineales bacterium]
LHLDKYLGQIIQTYHTWTYLFMFFIIFMETGFVVTPFLPGDSLLFAAGTLAGLGEYLNIVVLFIIFSIAAIAGDTANYWIGHYIGPRAFSGSIRFLKKEYLDRTHAFYEKHGGITIIIARFIPIIRTFAPFVAGVGAMTYPKFIAYNIIGGLAWVSLFVFGGYFFGKLPFIQQNFSFVLLAIIFISVLPAIIEFIRGRQAAKKSPQPPASIKP